MGEVGEEEAAVAKENDEDYLDELTGLAEPTSELMFSSSNAILTIEDPNLHSMG